MLVLSRKRNESIVIGNGITITVLGVRCNTVKLGIAAPDEVPVHRQEVADAMDRERKLSKFEESDMNNRSILVVSNDRLASSALASKLADKGGDVDIATTSACALESVDEKEYDVAIVDESLKTMRGQELYERLQSSHSRLKGILCSEHPSLDTIEAAFDSGMDHVVKKPIDRTELLQLVEN